MTERAQAPGRATEPVKAQEKVLAKARVPAKGRVMVRVTVPGMAYRRSAGCPNAGLRRLHTAEAPAASPKYPLWEALSYLQAVSAAGGIGPGGAGVSEVWVLL